MSTSELRMLAELIKARVGVPECAAWFGFSYDDRGRNPCPVCEHTSTSRKTVQLGEDGSHWWCHSCNEGGDIIDWIAARLEIKKGAAISRLAARLGVSGNPESLLAYLRSSLSETARESLTQSGKINALLRVVRRGFLKWSSSGLVRGKLTVDQFRLWERAWGRVTQLAAEQDERVIATVARMQQLVIPPGSEPQDSHKVNGWAATRYQACLGRAAKYDDWVNKRALPRSYFPGIGACPLPGKGWTIGELARKREVSTAPLIKAGVLNRGGYDSMQGRVVFPIRDVLGRVLGFGGRLIEYQGEEPGKYINTRDTDVFRKAHTLYAMDQAIPAMLESGIAVIVEGYTDAVACHYAGLKQTVACCGTGFTRYHALMIARWCSRAVVMLDGDNAGARGAKRALEELSAVGVLAVGVEPPSEMDPDEWITASGDVPIREAVRDAFSDTDRSDSLGWLTRKLGG